MRGALFSFDFTWVFGTLCFVSLLVVANGRDPPLVSPFSAPLKSPTLHSISPPTTNSIALPPQVMQIVIIYKHHHLDKEIVLAIALSSVAVSLILLSIFVICIYWRRCQNDTNSEREQSSDITRGITLGPILSKFSSFKMVGRKTSLAMVEYSLLELATNKFSESHILGEGGFGLVYKACFDGGVVAAVKKLDGRNPDGQREFDNEIYVLEKIQHPNVISLLGYCVHSEKRFLLYEMMQNGSLEMQLHGPSHGSALTWHIRMKIALDAARGLEYLHEHCNVIHRDLKSSNILLDSQFNAKISDFGLAVTGVSQSKGNIKLSGTLGYVAPEYLLDGKLTEKSDVYAFGVVLLELLMGRKPVEKLAPSQCQNIVTLAMPQLTDRSKLPNIVDPAIKNTMDLKHLYQVAAVAVLCVQPEPSYRPLITDVLHSLIPLVPIELGGMLRVSDPLLRAVQKF